MYHNSYVKLQLKSYEAKYGLYRGISRAFEDIILQNYIICIEVIDYFSILLLDFLDVEFCTIKEDVIQDFALPKISNCINV